MCLIQSYHPSSHSPRPTVAVVSAEVLRLWPLSDHDGRFARLTVNSPTDPIPWQVTTQQRDLAPRHSKSREAVACYRSLTPNRHAAKRMAMELLKGLTIVGTDD
jgi:hypothetical protein